jgi:hypothetical protein
VLSLEILTVTFGGCMACLVCYDIARKSPRANLNMVILATAELYGGKSISFSGQKGLGGLTVLQAT